MDKLQPILNWKEYDQYVTFKVAKKVTLKQWAWEFLRRQPEYQKDYNLYLSEANKLKKQYGSNWKQKPESKLYIPAKAKGESNKHWLTKWSNPRRNHLHLEMASKWCLKDMYSPQQESNEVKFTKFWPTPQLLTTQDEFFELIEEYPIGPNGRDGTHEEVSAKYGVIAFNLSFDVEPQLKMVSKMLKARKHKIFFKKIAQYLQIGLFYINDRKKRYFPQPCHPRRQCVYTLARGKAFCGWL